MQAAQNELITRVGPGTPCGSLLRQYWQPVALVDGSYPLSRALYIYVNAGNLKTNPDLAKFVDYYLSDGGIAKVADVGYVSLSDEDLQATRDAWATANK